MLASKKGIVCFSSFYIQLESAYKLNKSPKSQQRQKPLEMNKEWRTLAQYKSFPSD